MRILVCSNLYPPHVLGGYEILCRQVVDLLTEMGHSCSVLTSDFRQDASALEESPGSDALNAQQDLVGDVVVRRWLHLDVNFGEPPTVSRTRRMKVGSHNADMMKRALEIEQPDLVYVWSQLRLTLGAALAAQSAGIPLALNLNDEHLASYVPVQFGMHPKQLVRFATDRTIFRNTTLAGLDLSWTTSISQCLKERLVQAAVPVENSQVIYQGIPMERFPCKNLLAPQHEGETRLLYAGQLHEYKGPHVLLEAVERAADQLGSHRLAVSIAGDGDPAYLARLREIAEGMRVPVDFLGRVPHAQLPQIYREHQLFVFTSLWHEPFGLTHLEAMASGTPVISTAIGGTAEFLKHEENSLVFQPGDARQLASQIVQLISRPEQRRQLAQQARTMVEDQFTVQRYAKDLETFLLQRVELESPDCILS